MPRGAPPPRLDRAELRTARQQKAPRAGCRSFMEAPAPAAAVSRLPPESCRREKRPTFRKAGLLFGEYPALVRAGLLQDSNNLIAAVYPCRPERRPPNRIHRIHVGTRLDENLHRLGARRRSATQQ